MIFVDWTELANKDYSSVSEKNMPFVAEAVAAVVMGLDVIQNAQSLADFLLKFWFFGHSLGAHLMGNVGHIIKEKTENPKNKMAIFVGVDAAGRGFNPENTKNHFLNHEDAHTVIMIRTSQMATPILAGHKNFFVNGGINVVPGSAELSHKRALNILLELVKMYFADEKAIGYYRYSDKPQVMEVEFSLGEMDSIERHRITSPIYLPAHATIPFFYPSPGYDYREYKSRIVYDRRGKHKQPWISVDFLQARTTFFTKKLSNRVPRVSPAPAPPPASAAVGA